MAALRAGLPVKTLQKFFFLNNTMVQTWKFYAAANSIPYCIIQHTCLK